MAEVHDSLIRTLGTAEFLGAVRKLSEAEAEQFGKYVLAVVRGEPINPASQDPRMIAAENMRQQQQQIREDQQRRRRILDGVMQRILEHKYGRAGTGDTAETTQGQATEPGG